MWSGDIGKGSTVKSQRHFELRRLPVELRWQRRFIAESRNFWREEPDLNGILTLRAAFTHGKPAGPSRRPCLVKDG